MNRTSLIQALQPVMRAVASNGPIPVLEGLHIEARPDGIRFTGSSGSLTVQAAVPQDGVSAKIGRTGRIAIPASYFYNAIRKLDEDMVSLELVEPLILTIAAGRFRLRLCGMDPAEFPFPERTEAASLSRFVLHDRLPLFRSAVKQVAAAASTSEQRPILTGVRLEYGDRLLKLTATDGIRLASRSLPMDNAACGRFDVIVPAKNLYEIARIMKDNEAQVEIEVHPNRMVVTSDGLKIESVLIGGSFPFVKGGSSEADPGEILIDRTGLLGAVERVTLIAGQHTIRLAASSDSLTLSSRTRGIGDTANEVPLLAKNGESFAVSLNGRLLLDLLRNSDSEKLRIRYTGKNDPLMILPHDPLDSSLYLMTSIRTPED